MVVSKITQFGTLPSLKCMFVAALYVARITFDENVDRLAFTTFSQAICHIYCSVRLASKKFPVYRKAGRACVPYQALCLLHWLV